MMTPENILEQLRNRKWRLATAESCTGGLLAAALTNIPGSSDVFDCGFVTYSNRSKTEMLGVPAALIDQHGAVSKAVARAMAKGALLNSQADIAVAITGIAGPGGGTAEKPVGLVCFACATRDHMDSIEVRFGDLGREAVRNLALNYALTMLSHNIG